MTVRSLKSAANARLISVLILLAVSGACATSAVSHRAIAIADADREAKLALAMEAQLDVARIPARSLSVLAFTVAARDTLLQPLGFGLAALLLSDLAVTDHFVLVERLRIDAILRELDLVEEGRMDPRNAPRVGRLIGARRLLIGDISADANDNIVVNARIVDVIAGTVEHLVSARAPLARVIDAEKELAFRVFEALDIALTPSQRARVEQRQTTDLAATVAYGRGVEAEARGDAIGAVAAFEEAVRLDAAFAAARGHLAATPSGTSQRGVGAQRVLALSAQVINGAAPTKLPEAVDVPLNARILSLLITIRVF